VIEFVGEAVTITRVERSITGSNNRYWIGYADASHLDPQAKEMPVKLWSEDEKLLRSAGIYRGMQIKAPFTAILYKKPGTGAYRLEQVQSKRGEWHHIDSVTSKRNASVMSVTVIELASTESLNRQWRLHTERGDTIYVTESGHTARDTVDVLQKSDWWRLCSTMMPGQQIALEHPVRVMAMKDGKWWRLTWIDADHHAMAKVA